MTRVYKATAYDKEAKDFYFETYIVSGIEDTDNEKWVNAMLDLFNITDEDVHYYFPDWYLDGRKYVDTDEFFYVIEEEL